MEITCGEAVAFGLACSGKMRGIRQCCEISTGPTGRMLLCCGKPRVALRFTLGYFRFSLRENMPCTAGEQSCVAIALANMRRHKSVCNRLFHAVAAPQVVEG